ncbi:SDR family NAD(P)-dependent oxidoreductase [Luteococcus sp. H138]|uniref:SDR family NAD(P)-dependent oxidoreductase n=1 Tax=unclassified Luteococcus TaxID=2639923 RepID=UPI00313BC927
MSPVMTDVAAARAWAPYLRGLLADDRGLPRLSLLCDQEEGAATHRLTLAVSPDDELPRARDQLARLGDCPDGAVLELSGIARFRVERPVSSIGGGRLTGRVALVTGAAQGFGREIARELAELGCWVVLADLNDDGAREAARQIDAAHGAGRALAVRLDVADVDSFADAVGRVLDGFGGIDLLVSNAGIARAGSLSSLGPDDFDLVTRVNYRGYYVAVRSVAPVMAAQHAAAPEHWFDIVEINSKSGLAGSKRNFAYAGSKFGGIGLTQSFALELVEQGIKVNAVCPGNYLDGPLWTDPERGLLRQYLDAGKVPGATTTDDVRRHYEAQVPMGRGCLPVDVMRAVRYCVEQGYETGQAIPVTGGQTMLN